MSVVVIAVMIDRGWRHALRVAMALPLVDLPIVALSVLLLRSVPARILAVLQVIGGVFLLYLGISMLLRCLQASAEHDRQEPTAATRDFLTGVMTELTNPSPYIFWATVGGPLVVSALRVSWSAAMGFVIVFFATFMVLLVVLSGTVHLALKRGRQSERLERALKCSAGGLLAAVGLLLAIKGVTLLG